MIFTWLIYALPDRLMLKNLVIHLLVWMGSVQLINLILKKKWFIYWLLYPFLSLLLKKKINIKFILTLTLTRTRTNNIINE